MIDDGRVLCWGQGNPVALAVPGVSNAVDVSVGDGDACAVGVATGALSSTDTRVACWGSNSSGQLGNGTFTSTTRAVAVLD